LEVAVDGMAEGVVAVAAPTLFHEPHLQRPPHKYER
jgi:hypothetical protein